MTSCEEGKSDIIFEAQKICSQNGTYCHYYVTDQQEVNITFDTVNNTEFNYTIQT